MFILVTRILVLILKNFFFLFFFLFFFYNFKYYLYYDFILIILTSIYFLINYSFVFFFKKEFSIKNQIFYFSHSLSQICEYITHENCIVENYIEKSNFFLKVWISFSHWLSFILFLIEFPIFFTILVFYKLLKFITTEKNKLNTFLATFYKFLFYSFFRYLFILPFFIVKFLYDFYTELHNKKQYFCFWSELFIAFNGQIVLPLVSNIFQLRIYYNLEENTIVFNPPKPLVVHIPNPYVIESIQNFRVKGIGNDVRNKLGSYYSNEGEQPVIGKFQTTSVLNHTVKSILQDLKAESKFSEYSLQGFKKGQLVTNYAFNELKGINPKEDPGSYKITAENQEIFNIVFRELGPAWEKALAKLPKLYAETHFLNTLIDKNNQAISNQGIVDYSIEIEPSVAESISIEAAYLEEQRLTLINQDGELDLFDKKN